MYAILVHGMGRTPLSMAVLAFRLWRVGIKSHFFAYSVTFETWHGCLHRLGQYIEKQNKSEGFVIIGHSLGTVLTRAVLSYVDAQPQACFFLAPPTQACHAARKFAPYVWYRLCAGEMGQLLANPTFMNNLPLPVVFTKIYSGCAGPQQKWFLLGTEQNDCILKVSETLLQGVAQQNISATHTFIMNKKIIVKDICKMLKQINAVGPVGFM